MSISRTGSTTSCAGIIARSINLKRSTDLATAYVVAVGLIGGGLALWGGNIGIWAALTASITSTLLCWQSRNLEWKIRNYSKVVLELSVLRDRWLISSLRKEQPQSSTGWCAAARRSCGPKIQNTFGGIQEALQEDSLEREASLVNSVIRQSVESRTYKRVDERVYYHVHSAHDGECSAESGRDFSRGDRKFG